MSEHGRLRRLDPGFVVVGVICLVAVWPLLARAGLPAETDAELHIFRLAELRWLVGEGVLYPRWAPRFYYGYGYPVFNYYAPLTYYATLPLALLPGVSAVTAIKSALIFSIAGGAVGLYGLARDYWGRSAGYVAAAAFAYAPYIQYIDPHARGAVAEALSFGLFPLVLWGLETWRRRPSAGRFVAVTLGVTALALSHNLMAVVLGGLLGAWVLWHWVVGRSRWWALGPPLVLGGLAAAFFWVPVGLERTAVNLNTLIGRGDNFDFRTHFVQLPTLLAPSQPLDWGATEPAFRFNLGVGQWLLAAVGVAVWVAAWWLGRRRRWQIPSGFREPVAFFIAAGLGMVALMLPIALPVWEVIPGLPFLQFPWRLLGPAAILLALVAGYGVCSLATRLEAARPWLVGGVVVALLGLGLPLSQPPPWPADFGPVNGRQLMEIELQGRWLGTTSTADFVPATVDRVPGPQGVMLEALRDGFLPDPVNRPALPATAVVMTEHIDPLHTRFRVANDQPFLLRLFRFDFPGWMVTVDGERVATELGRPEGFLVVPVPAGAHVVDVRFGMTPARQWGWGVTAVALLGILGVGWWLRRRDAANWPERHGYGWSAVERVVGGSALLVTAVFIFVLNPSGVLHRDYDVTGGAPADVRRTVDFGDQIELLGYDVAEGTMGPGEAIDVTLYWRARSDLAINYQVFVHVLAADGTLVAQSDKLNPGDFPTKRWPTDKYVRDRHQLTLPALPGQYRVTVGLWVQQEGWRLPVLSGDEQVGDRAPLFEIVVEEGR